MTHTIYQIFAAYHIWSLFWIICVQTFGSFRSSLHCQPALLKNNLQSMWQTCPSQNRGVQANSEESWAGWQHKIPNEVRTKLPLTKNIPKYAIIRTNGGTEKMRQVVEGWLFAQSLNHRKYNKGVIYYLSLQVSLHYRVLYLLFLLQKPCSLN